MSGIKSRLTVFFEEPFWVGVFEQETDGVIRAARVVFGAQSTDAEVFEFVLRHADRLRYGRRSKAGCQGRPRTRKSAAARRRVRPVSAASAPARSRLYSLRVSKTGSKNARAAAHAIRPNRPEGLRSARKSAAKSTAATDFAQRKAQRFYFPLCFLFYASALSKAASGCGRWSSSARSTLQ